MKGVVVQRILRTDSLLRKSAPAMGYAVTHLVSNASLREAAHGRCRPSPYASQRLAPSHPFGGCARDLPFHLRPDSRPRLGRPEPQSPSVSLLELRDRRVNSQRAVPPTTRVLRFERMDFSVGT